MGCSPVTWWVFNAYNKKSRQKNVNERGRLVHPLSCRALTHECLEIFSLTTTLPALQQCFKARARETLSTVSQNKDVYDRFMAPLCPNGQERSESLQPCSHHNPERAAKPGLARPPEQLKNVSVRICHVEVFGMPNTGEGSLRSCLFPKINTAFQIKTH